jgi:hypothetical protein
MTAAYYVAKYTTKSTKENAELLDRMLRSVLRKLWLLDEEEAAAAAAATAATTVDNASHGAGDDNVTLNRRRGSRLLATAWHAHSGDEVIGAQRAALFLLGHPSHFSTHGFAPLSVPATVACLTDQPLTRNIYNSGAVSTPAVLDYKYRPRRLERLSQLEWVSRFERYRIRDSTTFEEDNVDTAPDFTEPILPAVAPSSMAANVHYNPSSIFQFQDGHPLQRTHGCRLRRLPVIPRLKASSLPSLLTTVLPIPVADSVETEEFQNEHAACLKARERYAKTAIAACISFRTLDNLPFDSTEPTNGQWWNCWTRIQQQCPGRITAIGHMYLQHCEAYYHSRLQTFDDREADAMVDDMAADGKSEDDGDDSDTTSSNASEDSSNDTEELNLAILDASILANQQLPAEFQNLNCSGAFVTTVKAAPLASDKISAVAMQSAFAVLDSPQPQLFGPTVARLALQEQLQETMRESNTTPYHLLSVPTRIVLLEGALPTVSSSASPMLQRRRTCSLPCPSIEEMAEAQGLNSLQRVAFDVMALTWLISWTRVSQSRDPDHAHQYQAVIDRAQGQLPPLVQQEPNLLLRMMITGDGGVGKSYVNKVFQYFVKLWGGAGTIAVVAPTGLAACSSEGQTWHRAIGKQRPTQGYDPDAGVASRQDTWFPVLMLILDESGMVSGDDLGFICSQLPKLKQVDRENGGVHIVMFGDLHQLKPIRPHAYTCGTSSSNSTLEVVGNSFWTRLNAVVVLTENVRAESDRSFANALSRYRHGQFTEDDRQTFNQRVVSSSNPIPEDGDELVVIVPTNKQRETINKAYLLKHAQLAGPETETWRERGVLVIKAKLRRCRNRKGKRGPELLPTELQWLLHMATERMCDNRTGTLRFAIGRRYSITSNDRVVNGIANGMWVEAIDVHLKDETILLDWDPKEHAHVVSAQDVYALQVHLHFNGPWKQHVFAVGIPPGHVLLRPNESSTSFEFPRIAANPTFRKRTIGILQFPLIPAHAISGHKAQSLSLSKVLIAGFAGVRFSNWLYVTLSRATALSQLWLETELPPMTSAQYRLQPELAAEDARLQLLSFITEMNSRLSTRSSSHMQALIRCTRERLRLCHTIASVRQCRNRPPLAGQPSTIVDTQLSTLLASPAPRFTAEQRVQYLARARTILQNLSSASVTSSPATTTGTSQPFPPVPATEESKTPEPLTQSQQPPSPSSPSPSPSPQQHYLLGSIRRSLANDGTCSALYMPVINNCLNVPDARIDALQQLFGQNWNATIATYKRDFSTRGLSIETLHHHLQPVGGAPYFPARVQERLLDPTADSAAHQTITVSPSFALDAFQSICLWVQHLRQQ